MIIQTVTNGTIKFGEEQEYTKYHNYPTLWENHDKKWTMDNDKECASWENESESEGKMIGTGNAETKFRHSYYSHNYEKNEFINGNYYDLCFTEKNSSNSNTNYWLGTRSVLLKSPLSFFCLDIVSVKESGSETVAGLAIYDSKPEDVTHALSMRPIVSINLSESGYTLVQKNGNDGTVSFELTK